MRCVLKERLLLYIGFLKLLRHDVHAVTEVRKFGAHDMTFNRSKVSFTYSCSKLGKLSCREEKWESNDDTYYRRCEYGDDNSTENSDVDRCCKAVVGTGVDVNQKVVLVELGFIPVLIT